MDKCCPQHAAQPAFEVSCTCPGCYLRKPVVLADAAAAEVLAFAHEQRWKDEPETFLHTVVVKDLNEVQPSLKTGSATGDREDRDG